jgi:uncharacterized protein (DUF305 family)
MANHYQRLAVMTVLSFLSMYVLMYAMVDRFDSVYSNLNQVYMAGLMTAPMVVIELAVMTGMYHNKRRNALIMAVSVAAGTALFMFIREQTAITDRQFLRSMIPHHSGAILMCGRSAIADPEIRALCKRIISGQQTEIDEMKALLRKFEE